MSASTSTLGLTKPAYSETADISVINTNMDLIDAESGKVRGNFSDTYDSTASYAVGDWCLYEGVLYRCTTAISGGETWDSTHWSQEKITGYLAQGTMRPVPMSIGVSDWTGATAPFIATVDSIYVTGSSVDLVVWDESISNLNAHIKSAKKSGNGGITFTTSVIPDGTVSCTVLIWDNNDGKVPVLMESTVVGVSNGGTGQSTVAGVKQAFGVTNCESEIATLNSNLANITTLNQATYGTGNVVYRVGRLCFISCVTGSWYSTAANEPIRKGSVTGTEWVVPADCKPVNVVEIKEANIGKRITIDTDGNVTCNEALNGANLRFSGCWITA